MTGETKEALAVRKRARRLATALVAASEEFEAIAELPQGPERSKVFGALHLLSLAAVKWMKACAGKKRKPRRPPGVTSGWLGSW